jgi:hypothetical protein
MSLSPPPKAAKEIGLELPAHVLAQARSVAPQGNCKLRAWAFARNHIATCAELIVGRTDGERGAVANVLFPFRPHLDQPGVPRPRRG